MHLMPAGRINYFAPVGSYIIPADMFSLVFSLYLWLVLMAWSYILTKADGEDF